MASPDVKLGELRARTDQQLLKLIHSKLELGLSVLALVEDQHGNPDHAEQLLRRAEQAVIEVKQLLPVLREDQRRGFGPALNRLQEFLDRQGRNRERSRYHEASMS
jgi:hypothetical protein